jgi:hypothetical protein
MTKKNDNATELLQALAKAMEQALGANKPDERVECEEIWRQMRQPGGVRRRLTAWRKERGTTGNASGGESVGAGATIRPRRKR